MALLDRHDAVEKTSLFGTAVHVVLREPNNGTDAVTTALRHAGIDVRSIGLVSPSLEDVFLDVVERVGATP
jgi:ribosomal protein S11